MLDLQNESGSLRLADAITRLPCKIELPTSWEDFFHQTGPTGSDSEERRQFPRWKNRVLAGLQQRETFPVIARLEQWHSVFLKDISRGGVAFIHSEQLYPLERMRLLLIDELSSRLLQKDCLRTIEVSWCRRVQMRCFEIGARFVVD